MTSRLHTSTGPDWGRYDTLVQDAILAFQQDVVYAIQVAESARSIMEKKRNTTKKAKKTI